MSRMALIRRRSAKRAAEARRTPILGGQKTRETVKLIEMYSLWRAAGLGLAAGFRVGAVEGAGGLTGGGEAWVRMRNSSAPTISSTIPTRINTTSSRRPDAGGVDGADAADTAGSAGASDAAASAAFVVAAGAVEAAAPDASRSVGGADGRRSVAGVGEGRSGAGIAAAVAGVSTAGRSGARFSAGASGAGRAGAVRGNKGRTCVTTVDGEGSPGK